MPLQIVDALAEMLTEGVTNEFTTIVILLLVAGFPVAQGVAFEVNTTVTLSLFANVELIYVELFVPTLLPLSFH